MNRGLFVLCVVMFACEPRVIDQPEGASESSVERGPVPVGVPNDGVISWPPISQQLAAASSDTSDTGGDTGDPE